MASTPIPDVKAEANVMRPRPNVWPLGRGGGYSFNMEATLGAIPFSYPFTSLLRHLLYYLLVFITFPFLTRFIYFLAFSCLPILPE